MMLQKGNITYSQECFSGIVLGARKLSTPRSLKFMLLNSYSWYDSKMMHLLMEFASSVWEA